MRGRPAKVALLFVVSDPSTMPNNPNPFGLLFQAPLWRPGQCTTPDPFEADEDAEARAKRANRKPLPVRQHGTPFNLPPQQDRIMTLFCDGLSRSEIAQQLELSPKTVDAHLEKATARIGARNRMQAAVLYDRERREGMIDPRHEDTAQAADGGPEGRK